MGVVKDIILLNYRPVFQLMVLFKCDRVTPKSNRWGNPMYKWDEDGFLLANFRNFKA